MRKLNVIAAVLLAACATTKRSAGPAPRQRIATIGVAYGNEAYDFTAGSPRMRTFLDALARSGFEVGRDFTLDAEAVPPAMSGATPDILERIKDVVRKQVAAGATVIVADQSTTALAALEVTPSVPIVFWSGDPVADRLVRSLEHPATNATGITVTNEQPRELLETVRAMLPQAKRVGVLYNPSYPVGAALLEKLETTGTVMGFEMRAVRVDSADEFAPTFDRLEQWHADAVVVTYHGFFRANAGRLAQGALEHRLPLISPYTEIGEAGALLSWAPDFQFWSRRAAAYVGRILRGARAADLPVEQSVPWQYTLNLHTARLLGVTIPDDLRKRAVKLLPATGALPESRSKSYSR